MKALTIRERLFVAEYLIDLDAPAAALRAGYAPGTAKTHSYTWVSDPVRKPQIYQAVKVAIEERTERILVDADWVLQELVGLYQANHASFLKRNEDGTYEYNLKDCTPRQLAAIEGLHLTRKVSADGDTTTRTRMVLPDKLKLLKMIGDHVDIQAFSEHQTVDTHTTIEVMSRVELAKQLAFIFREGIPQ